LRDPLFLILILLALVVLCIREGYMSTNDLDAAWSRLARRRRARGMPAERTPEWDAAAPQRALTYYMLAGLAVIGMVIILTALNSTPVSPTNQITGTVNGRPATPEELQDMENATRQQIPPSHQTPSSQ